MKKKLVIYGIGKLAQYIRYVFDLDSQYEVVGYSIEASLLKSDSFDGLPLSDFKEIRENYPENTHEVFIAVGNNQIREKFYNQSKEFGYKCATYLSSKSEFWPNLKTGENVFIGEGSVLQPFVEIGNNSFLIRANIGHHSRIGNNALLSVTTLGGNAVIENGCFLGMNSTIKHNVRIGENSIIGMNVAIEKDAEAFSVYTNDGTNLRNIDSSKLIGKILL